MPRGCFWIELTQRSRRARWRRLSQSKTNENRIHVTEINWKTSAKKQPWLEDIKKSPGKIEKRAVTDPISFQAHKMNLKKTIFLRKASSRVSSQKENRESQKTLYLQNGHYRNFHHRSNWFWWREVDRKTLLIENSEWIQNNHKHWGRKH